MKKRFNRRKLGITSEPISGLPRFNPYSLNLQRCETEDSFDLFACNFGRLIQKKSPNELLHLSFSELNSIESTESIEFVEFYF